MAVSKDMIHPQNKKSIGLWIAKSAAATLSLLLIFPVSTSAATISVSVNPTFRADLTNTLKLQEGTGNPTFTRATTATVQDFEGLIKNVKSGEARFVGARRVQNLFSTNTEGGTSTWTSGGSTAPTLVDDTVNGIRCAKVTFTAASNPGYSGSRIDTATYSTFSFSAGHQYQLSAYVKVSRVLTGGENIRILWTGAYGIGSSYVNASNSAQFVNGLTRVTQTQGVLAVTGTDYPVVTIDTAPGSPVDVWITKVQVEDVTGQANTNPSEYVSVGKLPAPYHGAGVDGVKYFNTKNGNTVTGYVVNEATGPLIKSTTSGVSSVTTDSTGPLGYLAEGSRANLQNTSEALDLWGILSGVVASTNTTTAPSGILTADTLTDSNNGDDRVQYNTTVANDSSAYTFSIYIKKTSGNAHYALLGLNFTGGSSPSWGTIAVNTNTGVVSGTSGVTGSRCVDAGSYWRCQLSAANNSSGNTTVYIQVRPAGNSDGTTSVNSATTGANIFWGGQLEAGAFASSYIPSDYTAPVRNTDTLTYSASNLNAAAGTVYGEIQRGTTDTSSAGWFGNNSASANRLELSTEYGGHLFHYGDSSSFQSMSVGVPVAGIIARVAGKWSSAGGNLFANGTAAGAVAVPPSVTSSTIYIGARLTGGAPLYGTVRNVKVWPKALTDAQLTTMTNTSVGWWKFDEGTGTKVTDASGLGNTGVINGAASWVQGKVGKALAFNTTNYVIASSSRPFVGNNDYTESAWFKTTMTYGVGIDAPIIWFGGNSSANVACLGIKNNVLESLHYADDQSFAFTPALNTWYHAAVVYTASNKQVSLYVNGVFQQTLTHTSNLNLSSSGTVIGGDTANSRKFSGTIDDARIYNRALSPAEITALYKSTAVVVNAPTNTSLTSGLVGLWSFDGKDMNWGTNMALDRSGSGNNGTLIGMSTTTSPVAGKIGQGLRFDGSIFQYVNAGNPSNINFGSGAFSIGLWVKAPTQLTSYPAVIEKGTGDFTSCPGTHNGWYLGKVGNNTYDFRLSDNSTTCFDHVNFGNFENLGWTHVVVTVDSGSAASPKIKAYKNGVLVDTVNRAYLGSLDTARNLNFGSWQYSGTFFKGSLDDTRIYNRVLSATEVKNLYNLGR
ncbi:MAG: hypothetical protein NTV60_00905 [Candidatus Kaiserbacteria bacterium]|nr:hypothetical protein [Candidatus Kaiserbacteria bacterium]